MPTAILGKLLEDSHVSYVHLKLFPFLIFQERHMKPPISTCSLTWDSSSETERSRAFKGI